MVCFFMNTIAGLDLTLLTHFISSGCEHEPPNDIKFYPSVWPYSIVCTFWRLLIILLLLLLSLFCTSYYSSKCVIWLFDACLFWADLNKFTYCSFSQHLFMPEGSRSHIINIAKSKSTEKSAPLLLNYLDGREKEKKTKLIKKLNINIENKWGERERAGECEI